MGVVDEEGGVMPSSDISKCDGAQIKEGSRGWSIRIACPLRDTCLRYTSIGDQLWQDWIDAKYDDERKSCWKYVEVKK